MCAKTQRDGKNLHRARAVRVRTCRVTSLSSIMTSFVRKSAPMVALYCALNFLFTYWFISDVLPTLWRTRPPALWSTHRIFNDHRTRKTN